MKARQTASRFAPCSTEEMRKDLQERIPENTRKKVKWALNILKEWIVDINGRNEDMKIKEDVSSMNKEELNNCLKIFVCEVSI